MEIRSSLNFMEEEKQTSKFRRFDVVQVDVEVGNNKQGELRANIMKPRGVDIKQFQ